MPFLLIYPDTGPLDFLLAAFLVAWIQYHNVTEFAGNLKVVVGSFDE